VARVHSVFEVIGPVMIGPSSSHTAGAVRLGRTTAPAADQLSLADEEGWIHLPDPAFLSCPTG